jgi:GTP-binding protein
VREITAARPLRIAVVGRPNAGKSTLINRILGEDRLLTGPEAGITRDAIAVPVDWDGVPMRIFDTAGMRKRAKVQEKLEKLSVADGLRAVKFAEVVVVLLDAAIPFETQDLRIADLAEREGRAVVVAVNKWDLEAEKAGQAPRAQQGFETLLPQLKGAPLVTVSAATGKGLDRLHAAILKAQRGLEPPRAHRRAEPLARPHDRGPSPARPRRAPHQAALHDPGQDAAPRLRRHVLPPRQGPGQLHALPGERAAGGFRHARHADPPLDALPGDKNPYKNRKKSTPSRLSKHVRAGATKKR